MTWLRNSTLVVKLAIAVATVVVLGVVDQVVQNITLNRIVTVSEDIQDALLTYRDRRIALDDYVRDNRRSLDDPTAYLESRVALIAGDALPPLSYSYGELQRVVVLPWHSRIALAKLVMIDHTDAWGARLDAFVEDPTSVSSPPFGAAISGTWRLIGISFPEALPRLDLLNLQERIEAFVERGQAPSR